MEQLRSLDSLSIREKKSYTGVPENWKLRPVCCLSDITDAEAYYAIPEKNEAQGLAFFRAANAATLYIFNKKGEELFYFKKHSGLLADKMDVFEVSEDLLGSVQKNKTSKCQMKVSDAKGHVLYELEGVAAATDVFHIRKDGILLGKISKRPSRIPAPDIRNDHFGVIFPLSASPAEKGVLVGALFLVDLLF